MNLIRLSFASFLLFAAAAVFTIAFGNEQAAKSDMQLCKHQYALCTSALCIPQPGDPTKAICFCAVEEGASVASVPCNTIQPSTDANGIRTVYSAFSLEQFKQGKKVLTCASGTPWTWCLNKRCTVDPSEPQSFWKRGSFRSGSNIGSNRSRAAVSGALPTGSAPSYGIESSFCKAATARSGSPA